MHLVALDSQNISGFSELTFNENGRPWIWMCNAFHIHGGTLHICGRAFHGIHIHGNAFQKFHVSACVFCNFRTVQNMNRYNLSAQMKRARSSDSITHLKKQNPTSRTEIRQTSLKFLFLETPCIFLENLKAFDETIILPQAYLQQLFLFLRFR